MATEKAIFFDTTKCTACKACQVSCKTWNLLPSSLTKNANKWSGSHQNPADVNGTTRLIITFNENDLTERTANGKWVEWAFGRKSCQHCTEAGCMNICPAGAISRNEYGFISVDETKCISCKYCQTACAFDIPRYWNDPAKPNKCTGCPDRVENGRAPACVTTCQPHALAFGDRDEMIKLAHERMENDWVKENFPKAVIYGENEMGGLHVIQILKYGAEAHGMPAKPSIPMHVPLMDILKPVTGGISVLCVAAFAVMYGINRKYSRRELTYNPETQDTIDVNTGEVVMHGDPEDPKSVLEHLYENLPDSFPGKEKAMLKVAAEKAEREAAEKADKEVEAMLEEGAE